MYLLLRLPLRNSVCCAQNYIPCGSLAGPAPSPNLDHKPTSSPEPSSVLQNGLGPCCGRTIDLLNL